ncbi:hypothetical protein CBM2586_P240003 [Cupriavidus phytorum]|uniref:Uncharacterized protein n=2 Tax=Cupriavidus TaxID=106589 RepID=A0A375HYY4_9BURK|nr:hypothetical protein CBM2586_P240003 [Cupriavidus taiwanensis]SPD62523.1 protein of unknown function [Cupriavidus neocaledonicus]SPD37555.1 protein of unknown function [Cupriavidus taiwanensis]SPD61860.1 protein of unknown function [Cupriavidus taiwanensis]SPD62577.1 protein of unknown function [Cupriavidus neocaledonicus]
MLRRGSEQRCGSDARLAGRSNTCESQINDAPRRSARRRHNPLCGLSHSERSRNKFYWHCTVLGIRLFATGWALLERAFLIEFDISLPLGGTVMKRLPAVIAEHLLPPQLVGKRVASTVLTAAAVTLA